MNLKYLRLSTVFRYFKLLYLSCNKLLHLPCNKRSKGHVKIILGDIVGPTILPLIIADPTIVPGVIVGQTIIPGNIIGPTIIHGNIVGPTISPSDIVVNCIKMKSRFHHFLN